MWLVTDEERIAGCGGASSGRRSIPRQQRRHDDGRVGRPVKNLPFGAVGTPKRTSAMRPCPRHIGRSVCRHMLRATYSATVITLNAVAASHAADDFLSPPPDCWKKMCRFGGFGSCRGVPTRNSICRVGTRSVVNAETAAAAGSAPDRRAGCRRERRRVGSRGRRIRRICDARSRTTFARSSRRSSTSHSRRRSSRSGRAVGTSSMRCPRTAAWWRA